MTKSASTPTLKGKGPLNVPMSDSAEVLSSGYSPDFDSHSDGEGQKGKEKEKKKRRDKKKPKGKANEKEDEEEEDLRRNKHGKGEEAKELKMAVLDVFDSGLESDFELPRLPSSDELLSSDADHPDMPKSEKIRRREERRAKKELKRQLKAAARTGHVRSTLEIIEEVQKKLAMEYPELEHPKTRRVTSRGTSGSYQASRKIAKSDAVLKGASTPDAHKTDPKTQGHTNSASTVGMLTSDPPERRSVATFSSDQSVSSSTVTKSSAIESEEVKEKLIKTHHKAEKHSAKGKERDKLKKAAIFHSED